MRSVVLLIVMSMLGVTRVAAQSPVRYSISFPNRGRDALHEFAKNVYNFRATGEDGRTVTVSRPNNHQWDVAGHGGAVSVTYTLYGDHADGTYVGIDRTHGHLSMPATFMWARGTEARPIELVEQVPEGSGLAGGHAARPDGRPVQVRGA